MEIETLKAVGLPDELVATLASAENLPKLTKLIEDAKTPVIAKNQEVLGKLNEMNQFLQSLGGKDAVKSLAETAARAKADAQELAAKTGDVEAIKRDYNEKFNQLVQERDTYRNKLLDRELSGTVSAAIESASGSAALLEPIVRGRIKAELVDGTLKTTVLTAAGIPMLSADGKEASITDLLKELKSNPAYARAFDGSKASGSGGTASGTQANVGDVENPWAPSTRSLTKQMLLMKNEPAKAQKLAAMHGITLKI